MRTARQGTLDGLCGLYAVVNALDLLGVDPPRGSRLHRDLFQELAHGLGAVALLTGMQDGIDAGDLLNAATLAFAWLKATHGTELAVSRPFLRRRVRSPRTFVRELRGYAQQPDTAAIISYERSRFAHWTAVREVNATHLTLRDSDGVGVLRIEDFAVGTNFRFRMADTLVIRRLG